MILLREIQEKDVDTILRFAQIPGFLNLPNDRAQLLDKIKRSQASFNDKIKDKMEGKYIFVAEETNPTPRVLGTSMIAAQHGTTDSPHFYFEVSQEEKFSDTINTGFIHGTLKLKYDTNGPSEIGGLVLDPDQRNNPEARVGRQISFVRFMFLGLNKQRFKRKVLAELMPPLNKAGQSPLWEAIGRRFTNMDYWEADLLCMKNKEFIFSLFPSGKIYTTFLTAEARNAIGRVGKDTEPVMHMLKKIGFTYKNQVDPFDGGPHLWANVDELLPLKKLASYSYDPSVATGESPASESGLLAKSKQETGSFRAVAAQVVVRENRLGFQDPKSADEATKLLGIEPGDSLAFMPYY